MCTHGMLAEFARTFLMHRYETILTLKAGFHPDFLLTISADCFPMKLLFGENMIIESETKSFQS